MLALTDYRTWLFASTIFLAFTPAEASALTFVQVVGLFHIAIGFLLAFIIILFGTAIGMYIARINTWPSYRESAIRLMEWGIVMIFVLILLIALLNFFQDHSALALTILAFILILTVAIVIVRVAAQAKKKPPARPARPVQR